MKKFSDIDALLEGVVTLPSIPATLSRITELLENPNASLAQVGRVISSDPGIAMKTMRLVNSASYGLGREIVSIEHAVVMLGARVIKNLVITATALETMRNTSGEFLEHCVGCGVAMRLLTEQGPLKGVLASPDEAFILGLFHDVGKLLIGEFMPDQQQEIAKRAKEKGLPWHRAEIEVIGVSHAELGGRLAEQWKLPPVFCHAISGHHQLAGSAPEYRQIAAGLAVANHLTHACGFAWNPELPYETPSEAWDLLDFRGEAVVRLCEGYFASLPAVEEYLSFAS